MRYDCERDEPMAEECLYCLKLGWPPKFAAAGSKPTWGCNKRTSQAAAALLLNRVRKLFRLIYAVVGFAQLGRGARLSFAARQNEGGKHDLRFVVSHSPSVSISAIRYILQRLFVACDTPPHHSSPGSLPNSVFDILNLSLYFTQLP